MYSPKVTQRQIEQVESQLKIRLHRHDVADVLDWAPTLTKIWNDGKPTRPFTADEHRFIRNEQILCKLDWTYWAERYCTIMLRGINQSGVGTLNLWESQRLILQLIAKLEERAWEAFERGEPVDGILIALNKARQLGATAISRALTMHRTTLCDHSAAFSASVDDDKVKELYTRDKRIYDNLPFYIKPSLDARDGSVDQQNSFLSFGKLDSSVLYQTSNQKSGLGQGRSFDVYHITECASFEFDGRGFAMLEHDLFPTIPQTPHTICIAESTPQGRGTAWHLWCELIRTGNMARWSYLFVPVYVEKDAKYRRTPPVGWSPSEITLIYANKVESTSPQTIGYKFIPGRDHLYWYETTRKEYTERGTLNIFLTNNACTSEESFQFHTGAAFPIELLQKLDKDIVEPVSYEFEGMVN